MACDFQRGGAAIKPLRWYRQLAQNKHRGKAGVFIAEGSRVLRQIAAASPQSIEEIISTFDIDDPKLMKYPCRLITNSQFKKISSLDNPQGILAVVRLPPDVYTENEPLLIAGIVLVLEHVQDPGNVGTLIRTAAGFGCEGVILSEQCADPFSPKVVQASAGSLLSLWIRRSENYCILVEKLKSRGYLLCAADLQAKGMEKIGRRDGGVMLALGSEGSGLSDYLTNLADKRVRVPIESSRAESLNVAVCGGILLYAIIFEDNS